MEDYDPTTHRYDTPTWQKKKEFQQSSFCPLEKQPYEEQLEPVDLKRFIAPFARKCCAVPYKIENERMKWLYTRYRIQLKELKFIEDCWMEKINVGKLAPPSNPLPSILGQNPFLLEKPNQYTDLGGKPLEEEEYWSIWDQSLKIARANQMEAMRRLYENLKYEYPKPPKVSSHKLHL